MTFNAVICSHSHLEMNQPAALPAAAALEHIILNYTPSQYTLISIISGIVLSNQGVI